ncbi:MAG: hemerythrin domain-containing protein [Candidatus Fervidibacter sp.]|uniref:hemerythrin domain-containing protein n=1 Tax=Candidatus Fervidibacter sp. TaxID=3100871 RepID=UPI004049D32F
MKRHTALHSLTADHHHTLGLAVRLKRGKPEQAKGLAKLFLSIYENAMLHHFRGEEEVLLPAFASKVGDDHPLIICTLVEHIKVHRFADKVRNELNCGTITKKLLTKIAETIEAHVRFEENELFTEIERTLSEAELLAVMERLPLIDHTVKTKKRFIARYAAPLNEQT